MKPSGSEASSARQPKITDTYQREKDGSNETDWAQFLLRESLKPEAAKGTGSGTEAVPKAKSY